MNYIWQIKNFCSNINTKVYNYYDKDGNNILIDCQIDDEIMEYLNDKGVEFNHKNKHGKTFIYYRRNVHSFEVEILLNYGLDFKDEIKNTTWENILKIFYDNESCFKALDYEEQIPYTDNTGRPFFLSDGYFPSTEFLFEYLEVTHCDTSDEFIVSLLCMIDKKGRNIYHHFFKYSEKSNIENLDYLIYTLKLYGVDKKIDYNLKDKKGKYPLSYCNKEHYIKKYNKLGFKC